MIHSTSHPVWKRLIAGEKQLKSSNVGINMLLYNSTLRYKRDASPTNLNLLTQHVHEYFVKFEQRVQEEVKQLLH